MRGDGITLSVSCRQGSLRCCGAISEPLGGRLPPQPAFCFVRRSVCVLDLRATRQLRAGPHSISHKAHRLTKSSILKLWIFLPSANDHLLFIAFLVLILRFTHQTTTDIDPLNHAIASNKLTVNVRDAELIRAGTIRILTLGISC
jgi:uncharacterized membrane protein